MKRKLYAAYGSNLNKKQMKHRCQTARPYGVGVIKDFELQFKGTDNRAFATVAPSKGSEVPIVLWEIGRLDEKALDIYEGVPNHYFKGTVDVECENETVNAMIYIMNLECEFALPSKHYFNTVYEGYTDWNFNTEILEEALQKSAERYYEIADESEIDNVSECDEDEEQDEEINESFYDDMSI